jgi:hypothetical protein
MPTIALMKSGFAAVLLALSSGALAAQAPVPLYDSIALNIGFNCRWQRSCIAEQRGAMKHSLAYVKRRQPPAWRVQLCNRNASRGRNRVDWVGFSNCIRNAALRPPGRAARNRRSH